MKTFFLGISLMVSVISFAQKDAERLAAAFKTFEADDQFKHALISLYIIDSKTGKVVFDKNSQIGLAPASCLKVVTSAAAFELLGKDYRYKTSIYLDTMHNNVSSRGDYQGLVIIRGNGDPTLGSWRFATTKDTLVLNKWARAIRNFGIKSLSGISLLEDVEKPGEINTIPDGYIWQDIGNYYGAMASLLNWKENQYDVKLRSSTTGSKTEIVSVTPLMPWMGFNNTVTAGEPATGDNAYIYCAPYSDTALIKGTIPPEKKEFTISGSMPNPSKTLNSEFYQALISAGINAINLKKMTFPLSNWPYNTEFNKRAFELDGSQQYSPTFDSMNYWFLQKSINLYGEAFLKTIARQKINKFSTEEGIEIIKNFWSKNGIERSALHIIDGCGLSPANRVTTNALVTIMQYAQKQPWFPSFYNALPIQNGIKMKSGYIGGARSYTGYIKSKSGTEYTFSFIINNYDGNPVTVREKMWKLLDILK